MFIGKFAMTKYMRYSEVCLNILGISDLGITWLGTVKVTFFTSVLATALGSSTADLIHVRRDFDLFSENLSVFLVGFIGAVKYTVMVLSRKKFRVIKETVDEDKIGENRIKPSHEIILERYRQESQRFLNRYLSLIIFGTKIFTMYALSGVFLGNDRQLPYAARYPFDVEETWTFALVFIYQMITTYLYMLIYIGFDSLFIAAIHHACGYLSLVGNLLENIAEGEREPDVEVDEKIVKCVRLHQNVYRITKELEEAFNIVNLSQSLVSTVGICVSGYQAMTIGFSNPFMLAKHGVSAWGQMVLLFVFNWCGQMIAEKSFGVSLAISRSKLYKLKISHQKDLRFILLRAQKPIYLTSGKFVNLSMENFSDLMKKTLSYFTLLRSVQNV